MKLARVIFLVAVLPICCSCGNQSSDKPPSVLSWVAPSYSHEANSQGLNGTAELRVLILPDGEVGKVEIMESTQNSDLDEAAIASVYQCEFRPSIRNGRAAEAWLEMKCYFPPNFVEGLPCVYETANPRIVFWMLPEYHDVARRAGQEGKVFVKVLVLKDGTVGSAEIVEGPGYDIIEQAAVRAASQCVFEPGVLKCKPAEAWMALPFTFQLK